MHRCRPAPTPCQPINRSNSSACAALSEAYIHRTVQDRGLRPPVVFVAWINPGKRVGQSVLTMPAFPSLFRVPFLLEPGVRLRFDLQDLFSPATHEC